MEDAQVRLKSEGKLNGDVLVSCNRNGLEAEGNCVKEIPCDGNGSGSEVNNVEKETENLGNELLEDLDSYLEDINDRLMISRMVNDSVIKGMVNAVEQEAAERIAAKDLEVACLMRFHELEVDKVEHLESLMKENELNSMSCGGPLRQSHVSIEHDKMRDSLRSLRNAANKQFQKLKKEIDDARGCAPVKRINSVSELFGLGGILREKECESWAHVDKMVTSLEDTVDSIWGRMDDVLQLSKTSFCEWKQEQEFQGGIEAMVMQSVIWSLQEEFEQKLWDQNAKFGGIPCVNWHEKFNEISNLRTELDAILKLLSTPETGQLSSHGSHDMDSNSHHKSASVSSMPGWQGNGKLEDPKIDIPENFETAQLKHLKKNELVKYFNTIITKMKRDHESIVQKMTEERFSLKREYLNLKERGTCSPHWKDNKEFDTIRRKIPDVIMALNRIIREDENMPALTDNADSVANLKNRFGCRLSENRQLRDSLSDKKNELKHLSSQVSYAEEKMLQLSLSEVNMKKLKANLNSTIEYLHIAGTINDDIYKCFLMELNGQVRCDTEESEMEFHIEKEIYDVILREAAVTAGSINKCCVEDSDIKALIEQEICGLIFREFAKGKLRELNSRYLTESEKRISLEKRSLQMESRLWAIINEQERQRREVVKLEALLQEKEKVAGDLILSLTKEMEQLSEQLELLSGELNDVREQEIQHRTLASERRKEIESVKDKLVDAFQKIEEDKVEICKLRDMLEEKKRELKKANNNLLLAEAKEKELKKQMEAMALNVHGLAKLLADFESKVTGSIKMSVLRLEDSYSQLRSLTKKANSLRKTGLMYKQRLEWRSADLQKAEAEVDLLGDKVDTLSGLLEKMYIALDHYSPILKHYPGIMEILQLVRRELSGESTKSG